MTLASPNTQLTGGHRYGALRHARSGAPIPISIPAMTENANGADTQKERLYERLVTP
jgi:hypothetical protein